MTTSVPPPGARVGGGATEPRPFGKYVLLAPIATGGMAEIWLARERARAQPVVIKLLLEGLRADAEFVAMFRDEARLTQRLQHENVVRVHELGEHEGCHFIAMEYLGGLALSALTKKARTRAGGLRQEHVAHIIAGAAAGLHAAHTATSEAGAPLRIVHRDVSPQNLVVTFDGVLKVVDFGIAKATEREARTQAGVIKGKFAYMSPEQCRAEALDGRSDVFSLGIVMWEVLTGRRLFKRDTTFKTYDAVLHFEAPRVRQLVPGVWPELDTVCMRALERDLDKRYPTAEAMRADLVTALAARGVVDVGTDVAAFMRTHFQPEVAQQQQYLAELEAGRSAEAALDGLSAYGAEVGEEEEVTVLNPERGERQAQAGAKVSTTFHASAPMPGQMAERVPEVAVRTRAVASGIIQSRPKPPPEPTAEESTELAEPLELEPRGRRWMVVAAAVLLALPIAAWLLLG